MFEGTIQQAAQKFCQPEETSEKSRELQILEGAEQTLLRAQEEIAALCGERPDEDTQKIYQQIETAVQDLTSLRLRNIFKLV